ncbi:MAG: hypothetical protein ABI041_15795, partial [Bdellovibrionia bacterium]
MRNYSANDPVVRAYEEVIVEDALASNWKVPAITLFSFFVLLAIAPGKLFSQKLQFSYSYFN